MRKNAIDNVEIVEPPIGELTKQRGSFRKTCLTGCGCVIFLIIGLIIAFRIFVGAGPQNVKTVPENFPNDIPVYEKDSIEKITVISGKFKNRSVEIAAIFPKVILAPLLLEIRGETTNTNEGILGANKNFWKLLTTPVGDSRDSIQVEWKDMDAEPTFVISYYRKELAKKGYTISETSHEDGTYQFEFRSENGIGGALFAQGDEENRPGTDLAILTVNIPSSLGLTTVK